MVSVDTSIPPVEEVPRMKFRMIPRKPSYPRATNNSQPCSFQLSIGFLRVIHSFHSAYYYYEIS